VVLALLPFVYAGDKISFHSGGKSYPIYKSPSCWLFGIGFAYWAIPPNGQMAWNGWISSHCNGGFKD